MSRYTTLLLDLDNTLLDFTLAEKVSITKVFKELGLPSDDTAVSLYKDINESFWKSFERGEITADEIYTGRFVSFLKHYNMTADVDLINEKYFSYLSKCAFKLDGCDMVLDYLYKKYSLYIVTNGAAINQHSRVKDSKIGEKIKGLFISEEIGFKKPQKEFFDAVFAKIDEKDKSKIIIIGDSLSSDILGGINAGIDTLYINRNNAVAALNPTYTVNDLKEILNIL